MNRNLASRYLGTAITAAMLSACGGNTDATIGGSVSGLAAGTSVALQDNGADTVTVSANGTFAFPTGVLANGNYVVTVLTQPVGQSCTVTNGSGSVDASSDNVSTVSVTCVATATLGGTLTGLAAGVAVTLSNGAELLPLATNGGFAFAGIVTAGTTYQVSVATQPVGQTCTVLNGTGTVSASSSTAITVTCS
jgi:hypothetical protein